MKERRRKERRNERVTTANWRAVMLAGFGLLIGLAVLPRFVDWLKMQDSNMQWIALLLFGAFLITLFVLMYVAARIARRKS